MRSAIGLALVAISVALSALTCGSDQGALGQACGPDCEGTWCQSGGSGIDDECGPSDIEGQCIGTSTGMYCTKRCASDADCGSAARPMRCMTACARYPEAVGMCWSTPDWEFMTEEVCPVSNPTGFGGRGGPGLGGIGGAPTGLGGMGGALIIVGSGGMGGRGGGTAGGAGGPVAGTAGSAAGMGGAPAVTDLGEACSISGTPCTPNATWCYGPAATCESGMCTGPGAAGFCSKACVGDADCTGGPVEMRCLTSCGRPPPDLVGRCWDITTYPAVLQYCGGGLP